MKKVLILSFFIVLLFSFSIIASAAAFPNSVTNLLSPAAFIKSGTVGGVTFSHDGSGTYKISGTATADISFVFYSKYMTLAPRQLYILYGGTDSSQVSIRSKTNNFDYKSDSIPNIAYYPGGRTYIEFYFYIPKGSVVDVFVKPVFALFNYTVYDYGTSLDGQTDTYFNQGYTVGFSEGFFEGKTEGYELGVEDGFNEGYKGGKGEGYELGSNNGEIVGYMDGYKSGYSNYKLSSEYTLLLENEYSNGFKEGADSVEQEHKDNTLAILLPMIIIDLAICIFLIAFKSRKRRKRK